MDFKYKIKVPTASKFKSTNSEVVPYLKFYKYVIKQIMPSLEVLYDGIPEDKVINVSAFWVNQKYANKLQLQIKNWVILDNWFLRKKFINRKVSEYIFSVGPAINNSVPNNYVYVREDFLIKRDHGE